MKLHNTYSDKLEEFKNTKKTTGIQAIKFKDSDSLANVTLLKDEDILVVTKNGMGIRFETKGIAPLGRIAAGVKSIKLKDGDEVLVGLPVKKDDIKHLLTLKVFTNIIFVAKKTICSINYNFYFYSMFYVYKKT